MENKDYADFRLKKIKRQNFMLIPNPLKKLQKKLIKRT